MSAIVPPASTAGARAALRERWRTLAARERQLLVAAAALLAGLLLWWVALQPALRTLRDAPAQLDRLDAQLGQMKRLAAESQTLRGAPAISANQAGSALKAATERLGAAGKLQVIGDRATLTLSDATPEQLRRWLAEARSGAHARPIEATLTRGAQGYNGTLVVMLPGGNP